jgi:DNA-binding NarL/FixJ family response regulator
MSATIKISLAESSVIIRSGLLAILKRLGTPLIKVFEVTDVEQLMAAMSYQQPEVLIINPSLLGVFSLQQIRKEAGSHHVKCVAIQHALTDCNVLKAFDEVISLYDGAEQIIEKLTTVINAPGVAKPHESLTMREKEVAVCIIQGMTNRQIADRLNLSTHTVITHRRNISAKLQIHSTAGLAIYAIVHKLIDIDDVKGLMNEEV